MPKFLSKIESHALPTRTQSPLLRPVEQESPRTSNSLQLANVSYTKRKNVNSWTREEDELLAEGVIKNLCWVEISKFISQRSNGAHFRSAEQCSQRWSRTLNPTIRKGIWLDDEIRLLNEAVAMYGTKAWSLVSRHVNGRTDIQCRTRYMQEKQREALAHQSAPAPGGEKPYPVVDVPHTASPLTHTASPRIPTPISPHTPSLSSDDDSANAAMLSFLAAVAVEFDRSIRTQAH